MSNEAEQKALYRKIVEEGSGTLELNASDPVAHLQACQWAKEIAAPYNRYTSYLAVYHLRLVDNAAHRFPLVVRFAVETEKFTKDHFSKVASEGRAIDLTSIEDDPLPVVQLVACEWALESGHALTDNSIDQAISNFPQMKFSVQAFPLLASELGISGGAIYAETHTKSGINWKPDDSTWITLPDHIQNMLPPGIIVTVQKCALQINRLSNEGFFKVQERWLNGMLREEYGTKVPLNNWMHRGIPHCITVTLQPREGGPASLIGVFDILEGSMASINEDIFATKAFEFVQGKSSNSLEIQFVKNIFSMMKQSTKEREAIQEIMNYFQTSIFIPTRNEFSKNSQSVRL